MPNLKRKKIGRRPGENPFFIFLKEFREDLRRKGLKPMPAKESACAAGARWRQMSDKDKVFYRTSAAKNRQREAELNATNTSKKSETETRKEPVPTCKVM